MERTNANNLQAAAPGCWELGSVHCKKNQYYFLVHSSTFSSDRENFVLISACTTLVLILTNTKM